MRETHPSHHQRVDAGEEEMKSTKGRCLLANTHKSTELRLRQESSEEKTSTQTTDIVPVAGSAGGQEQHVDLISGSPH